MKSALTTTAALSALLLAACGPTEDTSADSATEAPAAEAPAAEAPAAEAAAVETTALRM